jgi:hypothetical protein
MWKGHVRQRVVDFCCGGTLDVCAAPLGLDSLFMHTPGFRTGARLFRAYALPLLLDLSHTMGPIELLGSLRRFAQEDSEWGKHKVPPSYSRAGKNARFA